MVKRELHNRGQPIRLPNGNLVTDTVIAFVLVDTKGKPTSVFDRYSGELVSGVEYTKTDSNGEFSILLWATSRGVRLSYYSIKVMIEGFEQISAPIQDSLAPLDWYSFRNGELSLPEIDIETIRELIKDDEILYTSTWSSNKIKEYVDENSTKNYVETISVPSNTWTIEHSLNRKVGCFIKDTDGDQVFGEVNNNDNNTLIVTFSYPVAGDIIIF